MIGNFSNFEKINPTIALNILFTKEKKYFPLTFQIITQPVKKQSLY